MVAPSPLSEQDLVAARTALSAGEPFTVWFTSAAVGVPAGGSAKVISIDDAGEGDFVQVRAAGSRDTMFCSPSELTRTRPARKRAQQQAPAKAAPQRPVPEKPAHEQVASEEPVPEPPAQQRLAQQKPAPPRAARQQMVEPSVKAPEPVPDKAPERQRPASSRAAARPVEVTVTLNATSEGEWTVEVVVGKKRTVRPTPVQPGDVAKAARSLPSAVAEAIESSLDAARQRQIERVERLRAELDAAQRALQELNG